MKKVTLIILLASLVLGTGCLLAKNYSQHKEAEAYRPQNIAMVLYAEKEDAIRF
ncbi:MAG: hypothetical protein AAF824_13135 [Bacteroidota bacterium]